MERQPVKSSNIASVGHDPDSDTMEVEFTGGAVYRYADVPRRKFEELLAAESIGRHFTAHFRGKHEHCKLAPEKKPE